MEKQKKPSTGRLLIREQFEKDGRTVTVLRYPVSKDKKQLHQHRSCEHFKSCLLSVSPDDKENFSCMFCCHFTDEMRGRRNHHGKKTLAAPATEQLESKEEGPAARLCPAEASAMIERAVEACRRHGIKSKIALDCKRGLEPEIFAIDLEALPGFTTWNDFFSKVNKVRRHIPVTERKSGAIFYERLADAKKAVKRIGIRSRRGYRQHYHKDPFLPSMPDKVYEDWGGWNDFLGIVEPVRVYSRVKNVVSGIKRGGFTSVADYRKRYKSVDPRLPSRPEQLKNFPGWRKLLKKSSRPRAAQGNIIFDLVVLMEMVRQIGFEGYNDYKSRYHLFPGLPSAPENLPDFPGWPAFLGQKKGKEKKSKSKPGRAFADYEEACLIVRESGFVTIKGYREGRRNFYKLPPRPEIEYKGKGWEGWAKFLNVSEESLVESQRIAR